jgi:hypothetical protein
LLHRHRGDGIFLLSFLVLRVAASSRVVGRVPITHTQYSFRTKKIFVVSAKMYTYKLKSNIAKKERRRIQEQKNASNRAAQVRRSVAIAGGRLFTRIRRKDRERNRAFKQRREEQKRDIFSKFSFPQNLSFSPKSDTRQDAPRYVVIEREIKKTRTKRKHARCVPVAAALELRRAVVAKVVAHFYMYIFLYESVRVFVV